MPLTLEDIEEREAGLAGSITRFEREKRHAGRLPTAELMRFTGKTFEEATADPFAVARADIRGEKYVPEVIPGEVPEAAAEVQIPGISATTPGAASAEIRAKQEMERREAARTPVAPGITGAVAAGATPTVAPAIAAAAPDVAAPAVEREGAVTQRAPVPTAMVSAPTPEGQAPVAISAREMLLKAGGGPPGERREFKERLAGVSRGKFAAAQKVEQRKQSKAMMEGFEKLYESSPELQKLIPDLDIDELSPAGVKSLMGSIGLAKEAQEIEAGRAKAAREGKPFEPRTVAPEGLPEGYTLAQTSPGQYQVIPPKKEEDEEPARRIPYRGEVIEEKGVKLYWSDKDQSYKPAPSTGAGGFGELFEEEAGAAGKTLSDREAEFKNEVALIKGGDERTTFGLSRRKRALKLYSEINPLRRKEGLAELPLPETLGGEAQAEGGAAAQGAPKEGDIVAGYKFLGGDPNDQANWELAGEGS